MKKAEGKVAFVTGGASGIGLGMVEAFLAAGMRVVIADVREDHLQSACAHLGSAALIHPVRVDVTDRAALSAAADEAERVFGPVQLLCNNAGVGMLGDAKTVSYDDWDWALSVNLGGVINGVQTFLPRMRAHGQGGHVVNTSTVGAMLPGPGAIAYLTAKAGVAVLSECLKSDLAGESIGVTVLFPGPTTTKIHEVGRLRPAHFQKTGVRELEEQLGRAPLFSNGMDPREVGNLVLDAVLRDLLFVFTHNDFRAGAEQRFAALLEGFPQGPVDPARSRAFGFPVINPIYAEALSRSRDT